MINNLDELKFVGGYPTIETIQKLYDQLDLQRAVMEQKLRRQNFENLPVQMRIKAK